MRTKDKSWSIKISLFELILILVIPISLKPKVEGQNTLGIILNTEDSFHGYTLFGNNEITYLIDNCGNIVNSWESQYKTGHGMYILENGDLLRAGQVEGKFNAGGAGGIIEIFSWTGQRKWYYFINDDVQQSHHDLEPLPDGNILVTVWERHSESDAQSKGRIYSGEVWSEKIVELMPKGQDNADVVWQWNAWDHLIQDVDPDLENYGKISEHPERININYLGFSNDSGNWLNANALDYNADLDQIVISNRFINEIWIIDHSTTIEEAAGNEGGRYNKGGGLLYRYGNPEVYGAGGEADRKLFGQHDVHWVPEDYRFSGALMVFNNDYLQGTQSRIEVFIPPVDSEGNYYIDDSGTFGPENPSYTYKKEGVYSDIMSSAQVLPNGNILICEGREGYFFEINEKEELVWGYINPVNRNGGPGIDGASPRMNMTWRALRYPPDFTGFYNKEIFPSGPVELSPENDGCILYHATSVDLPEVRSESSVRILNAMVSDHLEVISELENPVNSIVYDISGNQITVQQINSGRQRILLSSIPAGLYLLLVYNRGGILAFRFFKY